MKRALGWLRAHLGVVFVVVALAARLPFAATLLCGEEGNFGRAAVTAGHLRPPRLVVARDLDGNEYDTPPGHNLAGYALPGLVSAPAIALTGFSRITQRTRAAIALRLTFLALYAVALFAALATIARERRAVGGLVLALFSLFTLPFLASLQVQYDGAVSTMLLALVVLAVVRACDAPSRRADAWLGAAAFLAGSGKLEFLAVAAATVALMALWHRRPRAAAAFLVGALAGVALCYELDRVNVVGGVDVVQRFSEIQSHVPLRARVREYLTVNAPYLEPLYWALPVGVVAFVASRTRRAMLAPLAASLMCFGGYVQIAWRGDGFPRYFAPVFVLLPVALAQAAIPARAVAAIAVVAVLPFAARTWVRELPTRRTAMCLRLGPGFDGLRFARDQETHPLPCVPPIDIQSAPGFYSQRAPFACCGAQWTTAWPKLGSQLCH